MSNKLKTASRENASSDRHRIVATNTSKTSRGLFHVTTSAACIPVANCIGAVRVAGRNRTDFATPAAAVADAKAGADAWPTLLMYENQNDSPTQYTAPTYNNSPNRRCRRYRNKNIGINSACGN